VSRRVVLDTAIVPTSCRFCGCSILWAITDAEARMPMNLEPHPDGAWVIWRYDEEEPIPRLHVSHFRAFGELRGEPYKGPLWRVHWMDCAGAEKARTQREPRPASPQLTLFDGGKR
jgi:hypothetical protein